MAPVAGSSHCFQKLKLDTSAPQKPVPSTFDAIARHDSQHHALDESAVDPPALAEANQLLPQLSDGHFASNNGPAPTDAHAHAHAHEDLEARFHNRTTSISFDNAVTLDTGNRLSMEEPLPKFTPPDSRPVSDDEPSRDHDYIEIPKVDRRQRFQHRVGESRYPLLQATVDDLAKDPYSDHDHVASLTSETTASPVLDEVQTPLETPSEYLLSPIPATSPIEFPPLSSRRQVPQRTPSYRSEVDGEVGSLRKASRRSSTRSGRSMSSMSPAASFLSRYKAFNGPLKPAEPDDEGQGIGYHGEYIIGKQIGFGGFSVVKEVTSIEDGKRVVNAVKIVRKQLKGKSELENEQIQTQFDHEVEIWRFLRHPYLLPLLRVYNTEFATYCITKLNKGGTLFDLIRETRRKKQNGLEAHLVKRYAYQLASAMRYLHNDVQVVHRDIKLENCLLDMTGENAERDGGDVLLCDFGMADFLCYDQRDGPEPHSIGSNQNIGPADTSTSIQGSLQYAAPELFTGNGPVFSTAADVWAFGVVVYALITAQLPFNEGFDAKTTMKIRNGEWDIEPIRQSVAVQDGGLDEALELVQGCLHMDPEQRWTVHDILECSWLQGCKNAFEDVSRSWLADS